MINPDSVTARHRKTKERRLVYHVFARAVTVYHRVTGFTAIQLNPLETVQRRSDFQIIPQ